MTENSTMIQSVAVASQTIAAVFAASDGVTAR